MNVFTVDVEEWHRVNYASHEGATAPGYDRRLEQNVDEILALCDEANVRGTFFTLGTVVEDYPQVVQRIDRAGHEVACHGYDHRLVYRQTPQEFRADVGRAQKLLQDCIGKNVIGYRAPSWSVTRSVFWCYEILQELGFRYSSSVFPIKTFLYGIPDAPRGSHYPVAGCMVMELPCTTAKIAGFNVPFSGGFYFRLFPYQMIRRLCQKVNNEGRPALFYIHPREIDPVQERLRLSYRDSLIHHVDVRTCGAKLRRLLREFAFTSLHRVLEDWPFSPYSSCDRPGTRPNAAPLNDLLVP